MVLPRFKTFCKHPLINLIEILPLAIQWYTVQNVSHKEGRWLIKCSIFLGVWLLLDFKMTYIKITHLYVFAAYSSIITTAEWLFNLGWEHDWKSDSLVWHSFTCWANGGSQCQPAESSSFSRFVCLLQRAGQSQHQPLGSRDSTLSKVCWVQGERTALVAEVLAIQFWGCKGDMKEIHTKLSLFLYTPWALLVLLFLLLHHCSYWFCTCSRRNMNQSRSGEKGFFSSMVSGIYFLSDIQYFCENPTSQNTLLTYCW